MDTLHKDQYTSFFISSSISLRMKKFSDKLYTNSKHTFCVQQLVNINCAVDVIMLKSSVETNRPHMTL